MIGDQWSSLAKTTGTDSLNDTHSIEEDPEGLPMEEGKKR
jgi:hypothetical protein